MVHFIPTGQKRSNDESGSSRDYDSKGSGSKKRRD